MSSIDKTSNDKTVNYRTHLVLSLRYSGPNVMFCKSPLLPEQEMQRRLPTSFTIVKLTSQINSIQHDRYRALPR